MCACICIREREREREEKDFVSCWDMGIQVRGHSGIKVPTRVRVGEQNLRSNWVRKPVGQEQGLGAIQVKKLGG